MLGKHVGSSCNAPRLVLGADRRRFSSGSSQARVGVDVEKGTEKTYFKLRARKSTPRNLGRERLFLDKNDTRAPAGAAVEMMSPEFSLAIINASKQRN